MNQLTMEFTGELLKQHGINQAVEHAGAVHKNWYEKACNVAKQYIKTKPKGYKFMMEEIRNWGEDNNLLPTPPSKRAWGAVSRFVTTTGLARIIGYGSVTNPLAHRTPASVYVKL